MSKNKTKKKTKTNSAKPNPAQGIPDELLQQFPELAAIASKAPPHMVLIGGMIGGFAKSVIVLMERSTKALEDIATTMRKAYESEHGSTH